MGRWPPPEPSATFRRRPDECSAAVPAHPSPHTPLVPEYGRSGRQSARPRSLILIAREGWAATPPGAADRRQRGGPRHRRRLRHPRGRVRRTYGDLDIAGRRAHRAVYRGRSCPLNDPPAGRTWRWETGTGPTRRWPRWLDLGRPCRSPRASTTSSRAPGRRTRPRTEAAGPARRPRPQGGRRSPNARAIVRGPVAAAHAAAAARHMPTEW